MSKNSIKNKNHHNKTRLLRIIKGFVPAMLMMLVPKKKGRFIFSSDHNVAYKHSSKYLFEYFLKHYPSYDVKFVINDEIKRNKLILELGNHFIETDTLLGSLYVLRAKTWVVSSFETPVGGVLLNWGRYIHHLSHGAPLKNIGLMENYTSKLKRVYYSLIRHNFSFYYSTAQLFNSVWAKCLGVNEQSVVIQPQARNNLINSPKGTEVAKVKALVPAGQNILYAPTWRPFSGTELFPFEDFDAKTLATFLEDNNLNIFLRLHPNFSEKVDEQLLISDRVQILSDEITHDINEVLGFFDLVITDYSSIYIDYLLTLKPVLFLPYDYELYDQKIGFSIPFDQYTPGPKPNTQTSFVNEINALLLKPEYYQKERIKVNDQLNVFKDDHAKINAEFILNKLKQ